MTLTEFLHTRVADVMVTNVLSFPADTPMGTVTHELLSNQLSGAPVVDDACLCLGVISVADIAAAEERVAEEEQRLVNQFYALSDLVLPAHIFQERLDAMASGVSPLATQPVSKFMVPDVVAVKAEDTLRSVIQCMVNAHIHRVIVTGSDERLRGLVSTTDILAAVLRAAAVRAVG